jgi:hypothetical protein
MLEHVPYRVILGFAPESIPPPGVQAAMPDGAVA